jgi:hypothetical protein
MDCCCTEHWQLSGSTPLQQLSGARLSSAKSTLIVLICSIRHGIFRCIKCIKQLYFNLLICFYCIMFSNMFRQLLQVIFRVFSLRTNKIPTNKKEKPTKCKTTKKSHIEPSQVGTPKPKSNPKYELINSLSLSLSLSPYIFFFVALLPNAGHGLLILEVSRSHTTHHGR